MEETKQHLQPYVRVTGIRMGKFIEFDFSIGDPTLYVELMLPKDQFSEFCKQHSVIELNAEQCAIVDDDKIKWRTGMPGQD